MTTNFQIRKHPFSVCILLYFIFCYIQPQSKQNTLQFYTNFCKMAIPGCAPPKILFRYSELVL